MVGFAIVSVPPSLYRVWTKNCNGTVTPISDWETRSMCRKIIVGRWHHWPPFAFISRAKTEASFRRANGG